MGIKISVLTLVKSRTEALLNLIKGLVINDYPEMELIVVHMNEEKYPLPPTDFPIFSFTISTEEPLPLAKARNLAVSKASANYCIFLDVDCIPSRDFISSYLKVFKQQDVLWSGNVRYLTTGLLPDFDTVTLENLSNPDPIRAGLENISYELFWSLNFGCSKDVFLQIGGFDESYKGYGAEDTDFAFMARASGIQLGMVGATAYHQPHPSYSPPLNHLEDIISNATVFFKKWQQWPMEGWLSKFDEMGYISRNPDQLTLLSYPEQTVIEQYRK
jgi:GT2 family glycosyltransferase